MPRLPSKSRLLQIIEIQKKVAALGLDLSSIMELITEEMMQLLGAEGAAIELLEDDFMVYRAATGIAQVHMGLKIPANQSLSGLCAVSAQSYYCAETRSDPRVNQAACEAIGIRSMLLVPLLHLQQVVGVFKVMSQRADAFSVEDQQLLQLMSEQTGAAMYFATRFNSSSLAYQATHDFLTGLANRSLFMEKLRATFAEAEKNQRQFAVLIIDMDDLKKANDTEGHLFGDELLTELAKRIRNATQATDLVARLGGDEFGVIVKQVQAPEVLPHLIAELDACIAPEFESSKQLYQLKASIGGACYPSDGNTMELLLDTADRRMYEVKNTK